MLAPIALAALLALTPKAAAADEAPPCQPLMSVGCYLDRPGSTAVLIYHRGYLTEPLPGERTARGGGAIPPELLAVSAAQAVRQYDLTTVAAALNASLVVTGWYAVGVDAARYAQGRRVFIAAHSGGVVGLAKTLGRAQTLDGIALLDCFYGYGYSKRGGRSVLVNTLGPLGERVGRLLAASPQAACGGFYTPHNAARLESVFVPALGEQGSRCRFDARGAEEHNSAVAHELVHALRSPLFIQTQPLGGALGPAARPAANSFDARWDAATRALERSMQDGGR